MITNFRRPMLAASLLPPKVEHTDENIRAAMDKLKYPVLATLKKDGIRAIRLGNSLVSRTLKPIPNASIRSRSLKLPEGFDMELWNPDLPYDKIESIVMSREHPDSDLIQFHVLDWYTESQLISGYIQRIYDAVYKCELNGLPATCPRPYDCNNSEELWQGFQQAEEIYAEGICFRLPDSPYKQGRSTLREQYLVKLARFLTGEAVILDFEEQMENANPTNRNAVGAMDRSSCGANLYGKNTLGALLVRDCTTGVEFKIGTGFDDKTRRVIWENRDKCLGKIVSYKHKPHGQKDKPRNPVYKGFREKGF